MALVFAGTYTETRTEGIYVFRLDAVTGALTFLGTADAGPNPTYLALHPKLPMLYAVNETEEIDGMQGGSVTALRLESEDTGKLTMRGRQMAGGCYSCHISVHPSRRHLLIANYTKGDGSVCVLPLSAEAVPSSLTDFVCQGQPGERSFGHCILSEPRGQFIFAANPGLNRIYIYHFDVKEGILTPHEPPFVALPGPSERLSRGAGPRHLTFSPDGRFLYCVNEYASSITAFVWNADQGALTEIQTISTLPPEFTEKNTGAAICFSPDGRYLYASNRGQDSLAVFAVDAESGCLTLKTHVSTGGGHPRDFAFDPTGEFVVTANRDANNLVVFRADRGRGTLIPTGQEAAVPRPVCVKIAAPGWGRGSEYGDAVW